VNSENWTELTPLGEEGDEGAKRLQKAHEELLESWGQKEQKTGANGLLWLSGFLTFLVIVLLLWNLSLRREVKRTLKGQENVPQVSKSQKAMVEIKKGEKETKGKEMVGGAVEREGTPEPTLISPTSPPSSAPKTSSPQPPLVPFPLPAIGKESKSSSHPQVPTSFGALPPSKPEPKSTPPGQPTTPLTPSAPPVSMPSTHPSLENVQVVGVILTEQIRLAMLRVGGRTTTVSIGDSVLGTGWVVTKIEPDKIELAFREDPKRKIALSPSF